MTSLKPILSAGFDGGNGELIDSEVMADGIFEARLNMGKEPYTEGTDKREHHQWFYFKASNLLGIRHCRFRIMNAGSSSYPAAWPGTWAVTSYGDQAEWRRTPTTYDSTTGELCVEVDPAGHPFLYVAYFTPFSYEQHLALIENCVAAKDHDGSKLCAVETLCTTKQGREIHKVTCGSGPRQLWFIARQHPGESMAEWWAKGMLARLLCAQDDLARALRTNATLHVVPNMNPDGAVMGHLRTNACGANLNREWAPTGDYMAPTRERSPEVFAVLEQVKKTGCDLFVDVHGDEELPHIFFAGTQGVAGWNDRLAELYRLFATAQLRACPAFQLEHGYGNENIGEANLAICADHIANRFDCLAVTLEMPYKDTLELREPVHGWSAQRCERLGASMLDAVADVLPYLRSDFPFANGGIGDGMETPHWVKPGHANPPSAAPFDTTPPSLSAE